MHGRVRPQHPGDAQEQQRKDARKQRHRRTGAGPPAWFQCVEAFALIDVFQLWS